MPTTIANIRFPTNTAQAIFAKDTAQPLCDAGKLLASRWKRNAAGDQATADILSTSDETINPILGRFGGA
jgi:hypothetical protein